MYAKSLLQRTQHTEQHRACACGGAGLYTKRVWPWRHCKDTLNSTINSMYIRDKRTQLHIPAGNIIF